MVEGNNSNGYIPGGQYDIGYSYGRLIQYGCIAEYGNGQLRFTTAVDLALQLLQVVEILGLPSKEEKGRVFQPSHLLNLNRKSDQEGSGEWGIIIIIRVRSYREMD